MNKTPIYIMDNTEDRYENGTTVLNVYAFSKVLLFKMHIHNYEWANWQNVYDVVVLILILKQSWY
jgi:hypothetical protein